MLALQHLQEFFSEKASNSIDAYMHYAEILDISVRVQDAYYVLTKDKGGSFFINLSFG